MAEPAVIVFDGVCALCSRWVRFLLRFDRAGRYRFAAMQGQQGSAMLRAHGLDPQEPMSFLLLDDAPGTAPARPRPVPEATSYGTLAAALLALIGCRRRWAKR